MALNALDVFVNCPFDADYKPIFNAIVFTVIRSGFRVRCALETDDTSDTRFAKICTIVEECRFGVHDISRTEVDGSPPLPRFNMPLELGLFLGAKRFGARAQKDKACIVFDRERFRFQRYISDIAGQDIRSHDSDVPTLIRELSAWLRNQPGSRREGGGQAITAEYQDFEAALPAICARLRLQLDELEFGDFNAIVTGYVEQLTTGPPS